jgi:hypothetical protein
VANRKPLVLGAVAGALLAGTVIARSAGTRPEAAIATPPPYTVKSWDSGTDNLTVARGTITLGGSPVSGVRVSVDGYLVPAPTDAAGHFVYLVDATRLARHTVSVVDTTHGRARGAALTKDGQSALAARRAAITVAYPIRELNVAHDRAGRFVVEGRMGSASGPSPLAVSVYSYELSGRVTDANGKPVAGARVSTRTVDRDYWTVSSPSDANGRYSSLFTASDEAGHNPVPFTVRIARGDLVYQFLPEEVVQFQLLRSARMDLRLPPRGYPMLLPLPHSYAGALYEGVVVGVAQADTPVRPVSITWPDASGRFRIVLPHSSAGKTLSLWEAKLDLFSKAPAKPGGTIDLRDWPKALAPDAPRDLARITLR